MLPLMLFTLGADTAGTLATYLMLSLALLSQIPKRFLWRSRPYMVGRAVSVGRPRAAVVARAAA